MRCLLFSTEHANIKEGKVINCHDVIAEQPIPVRTKEIEEPASSAKELVKKMIGSMIEEFAEAGL
jgi:hypothetical protein